MTRRAPFTFLQIEITVSTPSMTGSLIASSPISGECLQISPLPRARWPPRRPPACQICRLISVVNPSRTTGWLSAISTLYLLTRDSGSPAVSSASILVACMLISRSARATLCRYVTKIHSEGGKLSVAQSEPCHPGDRMHRLDTVHEQVQYSAPVAARGASPSRPKHVAFPVHWESVLASTRKAGSRYALCTSWHLTCLA